MDFSTPGNLLIAGIYYVLAAILTFFSAFAVYILIRYGKNAVLAFAVSLFYCLLYVRILTESYNTLHSIL